MDLITGEVVVEPHESLVRWNDLDQRGQHVVATTELTDVHDALVEAISRIPILFPPVPVRAAAQRSGDLWAHTQHLAKVARALHGFRDGGVVRPDPTPLRCLGRNWYGLFRVDVTWPVEGWVTYIHVVNGEFKKAGKTGDGENFVDRMNGSYGCLRKVIGGGPPYLGDPWKRWAPFTLLDLGAQEVQLWAKKQPTHQSAKDEEDILNEFYRGQWSKEGWKRQVRRPLWPAELNRKRARVDTPKLRAG